MDLLEKPSGCHCITPANFNQSDQHQESTTTNRVDRNWLINSTPTEARWEKREDIFSMRKAFSAGLCPLLTSWAATISVFKPTATSLAVCHILTTHASASSCSKDADLSTRCGSGTSTKLVARQDRCRIRWYFSLGRSRWATLLKLNLVFWLLLKQKHSQ